MLFSLLHQYRATTTTMKGHNKLDFTMKFVLLHLEEKYTKDNAKSTKDKKI